MPTIKLNPNGKIITKNGKVSCTCCEAGECCMYPAQALFDGLYTYEDLPDTVVQVSSDVPPVVTVFTKLSSPQTGTGAGAPGVPTTYFLGIDSNNETVGIGIYSNDDEGPNSGPTWKGSEVANESSQYGACLFAPIFNDPLDYFSLEDQFADTYTVSGPPGGDVAVTRISLCEWEGLDSCGNKVTLTYNSGQFNTDALWVIGWLDYFGPVGDCIQLDASSGEKSGFQNTPVGSYTLGSVS